MSLSREQYVAICETCIKRSFDPKSGMVCSLTQSFANFDTTCPDFEKDGLAVQRIERMKQHNEESSSSGNVSPQTTSFGIEKKMMSGGITGGILMIVGGLVWLIAGMALDRIFFYPFFLIIAGIIVLIKGLAKKAKDFQKPDTSGILDDNKDLEVF